MKRTPLRTLAAPALLLGLALPLAGCAAAVVGAAAAGGAGYVYLEGELKEPLSSPLPAVRQAAEKALKDLGLARTRSEGDALVGEVDGRLSDGRKVAIGLKSLGSSTTQVRIRVGTLGDEGLSRQILKAIEKHL